MKHLILPIAIACVLSAASGADAQRKPNILFVFSDDQRADTIHALGNPHITTPALDRLAQRGTAFTRAYCMGGLQGAVCVPSRAMLMSGRSLFRIQEQLREQATWPEQFGKAGYETFAAGKWHNGPESLLRSFVAGGSLFLGGMGDPYTLPMQDIGPDRKLAKREHPADKHAVEMIADSAIGFLKERKGERPFLLYVAMEAPHDPRIAPKPYHDKYNAAPPPLPPNFLPMHPFDNGEMAIRDEKLAPWPRTPEVIRQHLADYYAFIEYMDAQIGRIFDALQASGEAGNTFVVFASDQGLAVGSHGLMGKQNLYDDGMRVPLIFAGPGIPQDKRAAAFCYLLDVFPTLGALAGVRAPDGSEGISLAPVLRNPKRAGRPVIFNAYRNVQRAIRDERWKLIRYPQVDKTQLFDLQNDPHEKNDLAAKPESAGKIKELMARMEKAQREFGDDCPLTVSNPKPAAWSPEMAAKETAPAAAKKPKRKNK
ncbi:MAG: sulfatase-like hydrolase/transferase [Verrucomicrobia bacterium]|nr:sulfatase-like hydrolase/transferase [Verrucomicrobiota bacterium]